MKALEVMAYAELPTTAMPFGVAPFEPVPDRGGMRDSANLFHEKPSAFPLRSDRVVDAHGDYSSVSWSVSQGADDSHRSRRTRDGVFLRCAFVGAFRLRFIASSVSWQMTGLETGYRRDIAAGIGEGASARAIKGISGLGRCPHRCSSRSLAVAPYLVMLTLIGCPVPTLSVSFHAASAVVIIA